MSESLEERWMVQRDKMRRSALIDPEVRKRWLESFGTRATTALTWDGIITDDELAVMSDDDLLRVANLGRVTLRAIRAHVPEPGTVCPNCGWPVRKR